MSIRVAVVGAYGRLGSVVCETIEHDPGLELVARIGSSDSLEDVLDNGGDVAVEVTTPASVHRNTAWLLERGVHVVVGASGLRAEDLDDLRARTGPANCFVVPNFALGAALMMRFAAEAARYLPDVEILEGHHPAKVDAPSGTAVRTADMIAEAREAAPDLPGPDGHPARGDVHAGVPVHSMRLPGLVASQEVVFGGLGQTLRIRHDSIDLASFKPGVAMAVKAVGGLSGLTVGLEHLL
jgi:4-hydroxy-tetrahydrodipicolinate reductase